MSVDLYWLPLGAGGVRIVSWSGRMYEALTAHHQRRRLCDLYHSALIVTLDGDRYTIESAPVWSRSEPDRGVVAEGPVVWPWLGRSRMFRYEIRCWRHGLIPDIAEAVASPQRLSEDAGPARRLLALAPAVPIVTWGRDELRAGEMWNSNSIVSWLLAASGHDPALIHLPAGGRAPGWSAGLAVASRQKARRAPGDIVML